MNTRAEYRALAASLGQQAFVDRFAHGFLVRRPTAAEPPGAMPASDDDESSPTRIGYDTTLNSQEALAVDLIDEPLLDPSAWVVAPIIKRRGNPYPERISVGRAGNCDIVLRHPSISKLHAHLLTQEAGLVVRDLQSAYGVFVNGKRLDSGAQAPLAPRDRIAFATLEFVLVDAVSCFGVLRSG